MKSKKKNSGGLDFQLLGIGPDTLDLMSQGRTSILEPALLLWIILLVLMLRLILTVLQMFQNSYYGVSTILLSKRIVLLAWGKIKPI
jgi:membrane protein required for beta-lactamase induction